MAYSYKSITDPIYGYVGLSELEADIVSTPAFQRLHNVRQLGLAHLVFPSAGYSRFAHSIGACHNAGRILDAISINAPNAAARGKQKQAYRLAALLHDIGHYPFSHATEHAIQSYYVGSSLLEIPGIESEVASETQTGLNHEDVGRVIIENDPDIQKVFEKHKFNTNTLLDIFSKRKPKLLFGIISSDLDCDRLDYLRRSAHSSGVPYGEVDVDFIISKSTVDQDGVLCFQSKASTAIDHFLISRFYDYMQVVYHKTVVGLEWSLSVCVSELLKRGLLNIDSSNVREMVISGNWSSFDDNNLVMKFRDLLSSQIDSSGALVVCDHLRAILFRQPAKLVYKWEAILDKSDKEPKLRARIIRDSVATIARSMGIDERRFEIEVRRPFPFSSDLRREGDELTYGEKARSVSILEKHKRKCTPLSSRNDSLVAMMSAMRNFSVKVFYLPQGGEDQSVREEIRRRLQQSDRDTQ